MSYTRTALAVTTVILTMASSCPGTHPDIGAARGFAGLLPRNLPVFSHDPAPQTPTPPTKKPPTAVIGTATIYANTDELVDMARWALEQFDNAGIPLPPVTLHLSDDRTDCTDDPGRIVNGFYTVVDDENVIYACGSQWVLLHELGHVWDKNYLDDSTRAEFLDFEGLETWNSDTWDQAGGEHLASIIAWALEGTHPKRIGYYSRDHLAAAYELVFHATPPIMQDTERRPTVAAQPPSGIGGNPPAPAVAQDPS